MRAALLLLLAAGCAPTRFTKGPIDYGVVLPAGSNQLLEEPGALPSRVTDDGKPVPQTAPAPGGALQLERVLDSVTRRYPPFLSSLLERDLASGRLQQAMGSFDTQLSASVGGRVEGFYERTVGQALLEQPLATGDTVYGGYRIIDGFLPDYYKERTQDNGVFVLGVRLPLMRNRAIDGRRAAVRNAEIGVELAEPRIRRARIEFVRSAAKSYFQWTATGRKLRIARELLELATARQDGLRRAVERQFLAPIDLTDNERLVASRRILVARRERDFQAASLALSLYLRDDAHRPIVPGIDNLPAEFSTPPELARSLREDVTEAARNRPDLLRLQLQIEKVETDRALAENATLPTLDVIVETESQLSGDPYTDRQDFELFVGGELKMPVQRRAARGLAEQATARLSRLRLQQSFAKDRIANEIKDARSALAAARKQLADGSRNVELARELVAAEQRAFDLGRSDLLRIQIREVQLADARKAEVSARRALQLAWVDYRAALGFAD